MNRLLLSIIGSNFYIRFIWDKVLSYSIVRDSIGVNWGLLLGLTHSMLIFFSFQLLLIQSLYSLEKLLWLIWERHTISKSFHLWFLYWIVIRIFNKLNMTSWKYIYFLLSKVHGQLKKWVKSLPDRFFITLHQMRLSVSYLISLRKSFLSLHVLYWYILKRK